MADEKQSSRRCTMSRLEPHANILHEFFWVVMGFAYELFRLDTTAQESPDGEKQKAMKVHGGAGSKIVTEMKAKLESGQERIAG
jgi:hypothetical protein